MCSVSVSLNSEKKSSLWLMLAMYLIVEVLWVAPQQVRASPDLCTTLFLIAAAIVPSLV